jgi:hypothetical protein
MADLLDWVVTSIHLSHSSPPDLGVQGGSFPSILFFSFLTSEPRLTASPAKEQEMNRNRDQLLQKHNAELAKEAEKEKAGGNTPKEGGKTPKKD